MREGLELHVYIHMKTKKKEIKRERESKDATEWNLYTVKVKLIKSDKSGGICTKQSKRKVIHRY